MLKIDSLQVRYGDFVAVSSVSAEMRAGKITALIGTNGAGKSSLMNAVAGLIRPAAGRILFDGEDITGMPAEQVLRRGLCLVPQGGRCFPRMTVRDNLLMGSFIPAARRRAKAALEEVFALFPILEEKASACAGTLSGGQRQMVAIGRALMSSPRCLMFDEISLGLAPVILRDLYARIAQINRERHTTIVLVEQDTERALRMADYWHMMIKGIVTLSGDAGSIDEEQIRAAYFGI